MTEMQHLYIMHELQLEREAEIKQESVIVENDFSDSLNEREVSNEDKEERF